MTSAVRPTHQLLDRLLHEALGLRVEGRGGLVENQHWRILEDGAGDRQPLALAAGEPHAAVPDLGVVAERQLADELVGVRGAGRGAERLVGRLADRRRRCWRAPCR